MRDEQDDGLTPEEIKMLAALPRESVPPPRVQEALVAALRARGEIRDPAGWRKRAAVAAMVLVALALAFAAGTRFVDPAPEGAGTLFALLIFDPQGVIGDAQPDSATAEASAWAADLAGAGILQGGEKLQGGGSRVTMRAGVVELAASPVADGAGLVLGGFFLIRADSHEEALRIASACPLLRYGSTIEVRAIDDI